jgi:hypothetical protein
MRARLHAIVAGDITCGIDENGANSAARSAQPWGKTSVNKVTRRRIVVPPGAFSGAFLRALMAPRAFRLHVLVVLAEMQAEWTEAMIAGHVWHARWISVRGHLLIVWPFVRALCPKAVHKLF